jgi:hypothetical protein
LLPSRSSKPYRFYLGGWCGGFGGNGLVVVTAGIVTGAILTTSP